MKREILAGLILLSGWAASADSEPVQVLFPYTIVGRVVDAENKAFDATAGIVLTVRDEASNVLAKASVYTPGSSSAWNFRLGVPVASGRVSGYAMKGDVLSLTATRGSAVYTGLLAGDDARIGSAGASVSIRVMLAEDANGNGIADTYEKSKFNWMRRKGISGESFDPNADYDGDGQTNYAEYLAGTDPFDAQDRFGIDTLEGDTEEDSAGEYVKISFASEAGRTYVVKEAASLDGGTAGWTRGAFKNKPSDATSQERLVNSRSDYEEKTIYLLKQGTQRFYKLELEQ